METLLDYCEYQGGLAIFAINHIDDNALSIVIPEEDNAFNYLGFNKSPFSIPIGDKVEIVDDEGERHEITRLT